MSESALITSVTRGPSVESQHRAFAVCVTTSGEVRRFGDEDPGSFWRSVAKPFQSLALFRAGVIDRFSLTPEEIAVVTASHAGEQYHHELVEHLLDRNGLRSEALQCGIHAPFSGTERRRRLREGLPLSVLGNNCSGKHTGMLLHCLERGLDSAEYLEPSHPVQIAAAEVLSEFSGVEFTGAVRGVDGCGVPTYFTPLEAMARAFAKLSRHDELSASGWQVSVDRLQSALRSEPRAFSGEGRIPFLVSGLVEGKVLSKEGAEGVFAVWGPRGAVVIKSLDGFERGYRFILPWLLRRLDWIDSATHDRWLEEDPPHVRNVAGRVVGEIRVSG